MEGIIFLKGIVLGFVLCAPLGPIGILCVQRTLVQGRLAGVFSVLGAAVVDAGYSLMACLGVSVLMGYLNQGRFWLQLFGGLVLAAAGARLFLKSEFRSGKAQSPAKGLTDAFLSTLLLMLSSPLPMLVISAALPAAGGIGDPWTTRGVFVLAAGVFCGSALWAPVLVLGTSLVKPLVQPGHMKTLNRVCGAAVFACGLAMGLIPWVGTLKGVP